MINTIKKQKRNTTIDSFDQACHSEGASRQSLELEAHREDGGRSKLLAQSKDWRGSNPRLGWTPVGARSEDAGQLQ